MKSECSSMHLPSTRTVSALAIASLLFFANPIESQSQKLLSGYHTFSSLKTAYIHLTDGTDIIGQVERLHKKKGLIETVEIMVSPDGKSLEVIEIDVSHIDHMYIPASEGEKINNAVAQFVTNKEWENGELESDKIREGYGYFEKVRVKINKKNELELLLQLLNPAFSDKIQVYFDPFANESMGFKFNDSPILGAIDKSYYIRSKDPIARALKKSDYKDSFDELYGDCPKAKSKFEKPLWKDLAKHVYAYSDECP